MDISNTKQTQQVVFMYLCVHIYLTIIIQGKEAMNLRESKGEHGEVSEGGHMGGNGGMEGKGGNDVTVFN